VLFRSLFRAIQTFLWLKHPQLYQRTISIHSRSLYPPSNPLSQRILPQFPFLPNHQIDNLINVLIECIDERKRVRNGTDRTLPLNSRYHKMKGVLDALLLPEPEAL